MHLYHRTIACVFFVSGVAACTGPTETKTYPLDPNATSIRVSNRTGDIVIEQATDEPAGIVAIIEGARTRVRSDLADGRQQLGVDCAPGAVHCSVHFEIFLPPEMTVELVSESGNISGGPVHVLHARAESGSGNVDIEGVIAERLELESGSGNVRVVDADLTELHARSGSGDVDVKLVVPAESLDAHSGSGNVSVVLPDGDYDVVARSGSGDARLIGIAPVAGASASVVATSDSGDVEVRGAE